ncbi:hypothetical protein M2G83_11720 [Vibrio vulnificus]|nr:hypothetical protein [Vibrio vulnificus]
MSTQLAFHTFMRIEVLFFLVEHKKEPKNSLFFFVGKRLFLLVREQTKDEYGRTMGFVNYGEVDYVSHTGSQPMSITWQLKEPMPHLCGNKPRSWQWGNVADITLVDLRISVNRFGPEK